MKTCHEAMKLPVHSVCADVNARGGWEITKHLLSQQSLSSPTLCAQTLNGRIVLLFSTCGIKNQEKIHGIWNNYFTDCMTSCPDNGTKNARKMPEFKKTKSVGFITW